MNMASICCRVAGTWVQRAVSCREGRRWEASEEEDKDERLERDGRGGARTGREGDWCTRLVGRAYGCLRECWYSRRRVDLEHRSCRLFVYRPTIYGREGRSEREHERIDERG